MAEGKPRKSPSKSGARCECGRAYPGRLVALAFWTRLFDADLMRLRDEGMTYNAIAEEMNQRHAINLTKDQVYYRHIILCNAISAEKPRRPVVAKPKPPRQNPSPPKPEPNPVIAAPPPVAKTYHNRCRQYQCERPRANGYTLCLAHLPPLEITRDKHHEAQTRLSNTGIHEPLAPDTTE